MVANSDARLRRESSSPERFIKLALAVVASGAVVAFVVVPALIVLFGSFAAGCAAQ